MSRPILSFFFILGIAVALGCGNQNASPPTSPTDQIQKNIGLPEWALPPLQTATLRIGSVTAEVELAFTPKEQAQGLMYRTSMEKNHGMLFMYKKPDFLTFWMKNTRLPLSIAFIKPDGTIDVIREMKPLDLTLRYNSRYKCQFALEMNQGWFSQNGIQSGDRVEFPIEVKNYLAKP